MKKGSILCMVLLVILLFCAIPVSRNVVSHYETECSPVEYASQTNEKFYQQMVEMEENSQMSFNGFPTCLTSLCNNILPGDEILTTETDTLFFVFRDLNRKDINKYPYYVIKNNHGNVWTLFRHNDKFLLTKQDATEYKFLLEEDVQKQDLN